MKPEDLYCFREVSRAVGRRQATAELQKVINAGIIKYPRESTPLIGTFTWADSPQGTDFWVKITNCRISFITKRVLVLAVITIGLGVYLWIRK